MVELARALQARDYDTARSIHVDIMMNRTDECGHWMVSLFSWPLSMSLANLVVKVGVKRLISMSRATP